MSELTHYPSPLKPYGQHEIMPWAFYRARHEESIEERHAEFMANMARLGPPLGFAGLQLPPAPYYPERLSWHYRVKPSIKGLRFQGEYNFRGERYVYRDTGAFDDDIRYGFRPNNK